MARDPQSLSNEAPPAEMDATDTRRPMALAPPPPDTATDVVRSAQAGVARIPGLIGGFGGDVGQFIPGPPVVQPDGTVPGAMAAGINQFARAINPRNVLPTSAEINDALAQQAARMRNAAPSSLGRLSAQLGPVDAQGRIYSPQTTPGSYADVMASFLPAAASPGTVLQRTARVAVPAVTSETARLAAKGTPYEGAASVAGAMLGGAAVGTAEGIGARRAQTAATPTTQELFAQGGAEYRAHGGTPVTLNPQFRSAIQGETGQLAIQEALRGAEANRRTGLMAELQSLQSATPPAQVSADAVDAIRRALNTLGRAAGRGEAANANVAAGRYARAADVDAVLAQVPEIQNARRLWGMGERSQLIDDAIEAARRNVNTPAGYGGRDQALRREFGRLMRSAEFDHFPPAEQRAIERVANGTFTANRLQELGRISPVRNSFMRLVTLFGTGAGGAGLVGSGLGAAAAVPALGAAAAGETGRLLSGVASARAARQASELVRRGGVPRASVAGPMIREAYRPFILADRNQTEDNDTYAKRITAYAGTR